MDVKECAKEIARIALSRYSHKYCFEPVSLDTHINYEDLDCSLFDVRRALIHLEKNGGIAYYRMGNYGVNIGFIPVNLLIAYNEYELPTLKDPSGRDWTFRLVLNKISDPTPTKLPD